jgi:hypothetical protein
MKTESKTVVLTGKLEQDIYGNWSDVDKGLFIDSDKINSILWDFLHKNVRLTIEEIDNE